MAVVSISWLKLWSLNYNARNPTYLHKTFLMVQFILLQFQICGLRLALMYDEIFWISHWESDLFEHFERPIRNAI